MNIKHSKYKNTGILFELLVRQITADTLSGNDSKATNILKKYFVGLKRPINIDKVSGLEQKYGKVFALTNAEVEEFIKDIKFEFARIFGKLT